MLPDVRRIFVECGVKTFGSKTVVTFDDFAAIVEEFEKADPSSFSRLRMLGRKRPMKHRAKPYRTASLLTTNPTKRSLVS